MPTSLFDVQPWKSSSSFPVAGETGRTRCAAAAGRHGPALPSPRSSSGSDARPAGIDPARETEAVELAVELQGRVDLLLVRQLRQGRDGLVEDRRVRLGVQDGSPVEELVATPDGRLTGLRQPQSLDPRAVEEALAVEEEDQHRSVGRRGVELLDRRHALLRELVRRPAAHDAHPLSFGRPARLLPDPSQAFLQGRHAVPAQLQVVEATPADRMDVGVVESGDDRAALEVHDARRGSLKAPHVGRGANGLNQAIAHGEGLHEALLVGHGRDLPPGEDPVGGLLLREGRTGPQRQQRKREKSMKRAHGPLTMDACAPSAAERRRRHGSNRSVPLLGAEHAVGVLDAHAVGTGVLLRDAGDRLVGPLPRPVALPLQQDLLPGDRHGAGLDQALDGHVVGFRAGATGGVGHEVDLVAVGQGIERRHVQADLRPQRRDDELLAPGLADGIDDALVVPGVHAGAVVDLVLREDVADLGISGPEKDSAATVVRIVGTSKTLADFASASTLLRSACRSCERTPKIICGWWSISSKVLFSAVKSSR